MYKNGAKNKNSFFWSSQTFVSPSFFWKLLKFTKPTVKPPNWFAKVWWSEAPWQLVSCAVSALLLEVEGFWFACPILVAPGTTLQPRERYENPGISWKINRVNFKNLRCTIKQNHPNKHVYSKSVKKSVWKDLYYSLAPQLVRSHHYQVLHLHPLMWGSFDIWGINSSHLQ